MNDRRLLVHNGLFAAVDGAGDIHGSKGSSPDGLFTHDARHLSTWRLTADGGPLTLLSPGVLVPAGTRDNPPGYAVFREQSVDERGLAETLCLLNHGGEPLTVRIRYLADADFADQFELRSDDRTYDKSDARRTREAGAAGVVFTYRRGRDWLARTAVTADPPPDSVTVGQGTADGRTVAGPAALDWTVHLPAHGSARVTLSVRALPPGGRSTDTAGVPSAFEVARAVAEDTAAFTAAEPRPGDLTDHDGFARACEQGLADLALLRVPFPGPDGTALGVPAAGVPWFLTLFGRDSLLTSLFALPYRPELAAATLSALAATQGRRHDPARIEQPGKIVHEVRHGELSHFGQVPYGRYYGTVDATPLFLVLLHEYGAATGDDSLAKELEPNARAAVEWLFVHGGLDEHGYLVYTPDGSGLVNQCWKDSAGAICFRDGTQASGPIAVCEVQGYAFDALRRAADLARRVWHDEPYARTLASAAECLRAAVHRDFPMASQDGFPAIALDGRGRQVDVLASNAGHLLWSGILDAELGASVGRRLLEPDFFSGWGVRTLASGQRPYHPLSYHRGSVWPHDNAIMALGLARYGLREETARVTEGLLAAAGAFGYRLPEAMAGHTRGDHHEPIPYPHSSSPQAWAAATPLALLTAMGHRQEHLVRLGIWANNTKARRHALTPNAPPH